ncbi:hemicentin-1-like, partial, partial [Paramuricea clavata]
MVADKGEGGNPSANVTWYKDNVQIGAAGNEEQTLTLNPPEEPYFKENVDVGKTFAITCESNGHPSPRYTIIHNNTKIVSNDKMYTIDVVQYSDAGLYKCIAENKLGNSSTIYYLSIL